MQRVRIGLSGLAIVFLLVLLAAALFGLSSNESTIGTDKTGNVVAVEAGNAIEGTDAKDPLAELGVTPGNVPEGGNTVAFEAGKGRAPARNASR